VAPPEPVVPPDAPLVPPDADDPPELTIPPDPTEPLAPPEPTAPPEPMVPPLPALAPPEPADGAPPEPFVLVEAPPQPADMTSNASGSAAHAAHRPRSVKGRTGGLPARREGITPDEWSPPPRTAQPSRFLSFVRPDATPPC
jgi:hypothetical protein